MLAVIIFACLVWNVFNSFFSYLTEIFSDTAEPCSQRRVRANWMAKWTARRGVEGERVGQRRYEPAPGRRVRVNRNLRKSGVLADHLYLAAAKAAVLDVFSRALISLPLLCHIAAKSNMCITAKNRRPSSSCSKNSCRNPLMLLTTGLGYPRRCTRARAHIRCRKREMKHKGTGDPGER